MRILRNNRNTIVGILCVSFVGCGCVVWLYYQVSQVPMNAYAVWWTADLVIEHMEIHDGAWPRSWDDLRSTSEQANKGTVSTERDGTIIMEFRPRASIEELQQRVEIDWTADPRELAQADYKESGPPFRVIWLQNGSSAHYSGKEPNEMVLQYLKWKEKQATGQEAEGTESELQKRS